MIDCDLEKIAKHVQKHYDKHKIWPEYVELPHASFDKVTQGQPAEQFRQAVCFGSVASGNSVITNLYYRPGNVGHPVIHWSTALLSNEIVKEKPSPPNYRYLLQDICDTCQHINEHRTICLKYDYFISVDNHCDDWTSKCK